jgi:hypothetical protein
MMHARIARMHRLHACRNGMTACGMAACGMIGMMLFVGLNRTPNLDAKMTR